MAVFTQLSLDQIKKVLSQYGIDVLDYKAISQGNSNSNFQITGTKGQYMLTLCEAKNVEECQDHIDILTYLALQNFPTCKVIPTISENLLAQYNKQPLFLKGWIQGEIAVHINKEISTKIGKQLAQLHLIKAPISFNRKHSYGIDQFSKIHYGGPDMEFEAIIKKELPFLSEQLKTKLPTGLIHGDLFKDNVIVSKTGDITFIDFEEACIGPFIFDIGMAILGICRNKGKLNVQLGKSLIQGYNSLRQLSKQEMELLQTYTYYAALATGVWRYSTYNHIRKRPGFENAHREMLEIAINIKILAKDSFSQ